MSILEAFVMRRILAKPASYCLSLTLIFCSFGSLEALAAWNNEPTGSQLITEFRFDAVQGNGWSAVYPGGGAIVSDPTAKASAPNTLMYIRQPNSIGNSSVTYYNLPTLNEMYFAFWWKASDPFEGQPHLLTKIANVWVNGGNGTLGLLWFYMKAAQRGGPYQLIMQLEFPNVGNSHLGNGYGDNPGTWNLFGNVSGGSISLGNWHLLELQLRTSSTPTARNGQLTWWMDGTPIGKYSNVNFPNSAVNMVQFATSWDSQDPTQQQPYYFWYDHARISKPSGGATLDSPPGPPSAPRIQSITVQ
jgi:hypothetical protein